MATNQQVVGRVGVQPRQSSGVWRDAFGRLRKNRLALVGLFGILFLAFIGIFGPMITPWPYYAQDTAAVTANGFKPIPPFTSAAHILGTDQLGQDMLSRLLDGARISLTVAIVVQFVVIGIGVPIGAIAGWYSGSRIDNGLMRFTDVMYAFPDLLLIILFSVAFRETAFGQALNGLLLVFVAIGLVSLGDGRPARPRPVPVAQGDRVRRGRPGHRRVRPEHHHEAPAAQRHQPDHRGHHARASRRPSSPRRRSPTSASASSRHARRGAA